MPEEFVASFSGQTLSNFSFFIPFSTGRTKLFWVVVRNQHQVVAAAPVVQLVRRKATQMLRQPFKRWLGLLFGPLAVKTTLLVDTSFLAYDYVSPFFCLDSDPTNIKQRIVAFLQSQPGVDTVWISEPLEAASWAMEEDFEQFLTLPMVHTEVSGFATLENFIDDQSKKRRRNFRNEQTTFVEAGGVIEEFQAPLVTEAHDKMSKMSLPNEQLVDELLNCLEASAAHSAFNVPYNDVLTDPKAFAAQPQTILVARVEGHVVGFMSFIQQDDRLLQSHGGLDYELSHKVLAYHNLIYAGIELAIRRKCRLLSMGPLNNETKRRAGKQLKPVVSSLWSRLPLDRLIARKLFNRNFEVYRGELPS